MSLFCPKCGGPLVPQYINGTKIFFCNLCVRGYREHWLKAIQDEIDMTLSMFDRLEKK